MLRVPQVRAKKISPISVPSGFKPWILQLNKSKTEKSFWWFFCSDSLLPISKNKKKYVSWKCKLYLFFWNFPRYTSNFTSAHHSLLTSHIIFSFFWTAAYTHLGRCVIRRRPSLCAQLCISYFLCAFIFIRKLQPQDQTLRTLRNLRNLRKNLKVARYFLKVWFFSRSLSVDKGFCFCLKVGKRFCFLKVSPSFSRFS